MSVVIDASIGIQWVVKEAGDARNVKHAWLIQQVVTLGSI